MKYLDFFGFGVLRAAFLPPAADAEDTTAAEVEAIPATVVAAIPATPVPDPTDRFSADGVMAPGAVFLPLFSYNARIVLEPFSRGMLCILKAKCSY